MQIPNVYERLKSEGVVFNTVTAGKYKRQLTPTKKTDPKDVEKTERDLQDILTLFKAVVAKHRPQIDIESVATGEIWFGPDALEKQLCDELKTSDDVLLEYVKLGHDVYSVQTSNKPASLLEELSTASVSGVGRWFRQIVVEVRSWSPNIVPRTLLVALLSDRDNDNNCNVSQP